MAKRLFFRSPTGAVAFVETGFNWIAVIFGPLWAIPKRQWSMSLLLLAVQLPQIVISLLAELRRDTGLFALSAFLLLIYMIFCGVFTNRLYRYFLETQGYVFEDTV